MVNFVPVQILIATSSDEEELDIDDATAADIELYGLIASCVDKCALKYFSKHNDFVEFNNLPRELIHAILEDAVSHAGSAYFDQLTNLRLVCKSWKALIDASPQFWTHVHLDRPVSFVEKVVERSHGKALAVRQGSGQTYEKPGCYTLLQLIADRHWPIRSFHFRKPTEETVETTHLTTFLERPAPHIHVLDLDLPRPSTSPPGTSLLVGDLFGHEAPNLHTLRLQDVAINWTMLSFPKLQSLKLGSLRKPEEHRLSIGRLSQLLARCPGLVTLELDNLTFDKSSNPTEPTTSPPPLTLEHLTTILFENMDGIDAYGILRPLNAPTLNELNIRALTRSGVSKLLEIVPTMMGSATQEVVVDLVDKGGMWLWMEVRGVGWMVETGRTMVYGTQAPPFSSLLLQSLPPNIRNSVSTFRLSDYLSQPPVRRQLFPILHLAFPGLSTLSMTTRCTVVPYIPQLARALPGGGSHGPFELNMLSAPSVTGASSQWLFPNMRTFILQSSSYGLLTAEHLSQVVQMAKARRAAGPEAVASVATFKTGSRLNPKLKGVGKAVFEEIEEVFESIEYNPETRREERGEFAPEHIVFV